MNKYLIGAAAALTLAASSVFAGSLSPVGVVEVVPASSYNSVLGPNASFVGSLDYAIESKTTTAEFGVEFITGDFTITPYLVGSHDSATSTNFTGAALAVVYGVNANFNVYGEISTDDSFSYDEAILGVGFRF